jgi:hypothetical protein
MEKTEKTGPHNICNLADKPTQPENISDVDSPHQQGGQLQGILAYPDDQALWLIIAHHCRSYVGVFLNVFTCKSVM